VTLLFSDEFVTSLKKHGAIKDAVRKRVEMIAANPIALGEPLKGNFRGFYSTPVRRNFLIVFLYCAVCRKKHDDAIVLCGDCASRPDDTIQFIALGPHDQVYWG
jgi:hypothetical protein